MVTLCVRRDSVIVVIGSDVELWNSENMTKINPFLNVLFPLFAILLCIISQCLAALSDKQLCYDSNCSEPVSLAKTIMAYVPNDRELMSFANNVDVKVFSKGAGKRIDLWGVEINGKRGFVPRSFLKEYKILRGDLSYEVPVPKYTGEVKKVQTNKFESAEEAHKTQSLLTTLPLKRKLSHDDEALPLDKIVDKNVQESEVVNENSILSSYEVIDGTTVYFENKPSVQPSFVSEVAHATALPRKQTSDTDSEADAGSSSDENIFINSNELQSDTDTDSNKLEGIELLVETHENNTSEILLESSETIINSNLDAVNKNDNLALDRSSEFEDKSENLKHEKAIDASEENIEDDKEEEISENTETEGIFASLTKTFKMLSNSEEAESTESITTPSSIDIPAPETTTESSTVLQEVSEDVRVKNTVIEEETIPTTEIENTNIDASVTSKEKLEIQQEVMQNDIESTKISDEKMKTEQEASAILSENATSSSDVPLSNNFVHVNADNSVKESPVASSIDDSSDSAKTETNSHVNIQVEETSKEEEVTENVSIENVITSEESTESFDSQETSTESTIQSSNGIHQILSGNIKMHPENVKKDVGHTDTTAQKIGETDEIAENSNLSPVKEIAKDVTKESFPYKIYNFGGNIAIANETLDHNAADTQLAEKLIVHNNVNKNDNLTNDASFDNVPIEPNQFSNDVKPSISDSEQSAGSSQKSMISERITTFNEIPQNRNLLNIEEDLEHKNIEDQDVNDEEILTEYGNQINSEDKILYKDDDIKEDNSEKSESKSISDEVCSLDHECTTESIGGFLEQKEEPENKEDNFLDIKLDHNYWKTLIYLCVTVFTTLVFTLGYYYIENIRRDGQLIARINKLEKELLVSTKESEVLSENLKSTKDKLNCIEDESFGSNEMVVSLKTELEESQIVRAELEDQVTTLEKELENASEAGLEIERMLREVLSSNNAVNPLAQSVEDLQARLDAQQAANESLTNALNLKAQEIETLTMDLVTVKKKCEKFEVELSQARDELATQKNLKNDIEETLTDKVHNLEKQINEVSTEKSSLYTELRSKEIEIDGLKEIISHIKSNSLDLEKLYDVSHVKIEAVQLREERDELKMRLNDVEGAHQLLEEHTKLIKEEIAALSDQCKIAEKEKKEAETKLEVLAKFFKEKEAERQKEEALWLQKQGEVVSTVERIHTMQNEIQNYKQQIEIFKREIVDQEKEYKTQISALETKAHEQWVAARQNERRLEESKAEAGQLRNRLTLKEKNLLNDSDIETELHRLEANGDTSPLFLRAESSNSPIMFSSSGVPPPRRPPSYLHCFPPYLPPLPPAAPGLPPYDISQRPPPLGGRLSSPPPMPPLHPPASRGRYENAGSPPSPMSPPHLLPPYSRHRSPPLPPFGSDHIPPPPLPGSMLPPPLDTTHPWGEESLPPPRNSGFHPHQRDQRMRNHKGSLHSSGESLDKAHHGKV
ncbi:transport and Golgi organization protein 1 isoform X1 [Linepithema humile]|uniref:transport and Golgi organization protein 1 isoform X1 n=1 Tax=Linepithema humile TaxID=83485 RepID=UPI00062359C4|nr:PREDICTED: transport and Golgi organization protein 1 isoform X2 [Linepithema humile]